jgi:tRNA(Arg) A34 adenosine deaminase TadA
MPLQPSDERHLLAAIELSRHARERGNHPFGALLADAAGNPVLEAGNTVVTTRDVTGHAELNLVRAAAERFDTAFLRGCTLYASTEPCAMCAGAIYWSGIGRVVFALAGETFRPLVEGEDALSLSCRDVLARGGRRVEVEGPALEDEALALHEGFW